MLIDWFTVAAQIVNFLVLVYLLKRFLYGPIIKAMDAREKAILGRLEAADKQRTDAEALKVAYDQKNRDLDSRREQLLSEIKQDVENRRRALIDDARTEVDNLRSSWHEIIQREKGAFLQALRQRAGRQLFVAGRRALHDMADVHLEQQMIRVFSERLRNLDDSERAGLKEAIGQSKEAIRLRSAFEIPQESAQEIERLLEELGAGPIQIEKEISQDVICGIELQVHGRKIAWSLDDHMKALEISVAEAFETGRFPTTPGSEPERQPQAEKITSGLSDH